MGRRWVAGLVGILVIAGIGVALASVLLKPSIPADAASVAVTRTVMTGPLPGQPTAGPEATPGDVPPGDVPANTPSGQACLDRIQRGAGWLDLCWQAEHSAGDGDPQQDYYVLRLYGSHQGLRWVAIGSRLVGTPAFGGYDEWPTRGTYVGECREIAMGLPLSMTGFQSDQVCGHTESTFDSGTWTQRLTWTSEELLGGDQTTREIAMWAFVGVKPDEVPSWDLFADGGS